MQATAVKILVSMLMKLFDPKLMKEFIEELLNWIEKRVLGSASKVDDAIILPLIQHVKVVFEIP